MLTYEHEVLFNKLRDEKEKRLREERKKIDPNYVDPDEVQLSEEHKQQKAYMDTLTPREKLRYKLRLELNGGHLREYNPNLSYKIIKKRTLCFAGNIFNRLPWRRNKNDERYKQVRKELDEKLEQAINDGYTTFLSNVRIGFESMCVEEVLKLKKKYPKIKFIAVIPFKTIHTKWDIKDQIKYNNLLSQADEIRCLVEELNFTDYIEKVEEFILDHSSRMITLYFNNNGPVEKRINNAKEKNIDIVYLTPIYKPIKKTLN